ncbi:hypothetical protein A2372_03125 [Candidatus Wolfebacteria bacterium RIFOXYB1_FULL_54_12]|uniref:Uncharacterized protein n=1 Tax=Candidatus Wolfebacteria bacterium RIFOXYB1_FULL_54_12 TaxID=1802559 RepID=A0A1F8E014_9BACT|nr:MAG: hypothetical protein A2372_03125 [Candidatus Wolfebacteria bacterium RIFOXYB1_FULL_54_12]
MAGRGNVFRHIHRDVTRTESVLKFHTRRYRKTQKARTNYRKSEESYSSSLFYFLFIPGAAMSAFYLIPPFLECLFKIDIEIIGDIQQIVKYIGQLMRHGKSRLFAR